MKQQQFILCIFILLSLCTSSLRAQQNYSGESVFDCGDQSSSTPSTSYLYTCNGQKPSCKAFLLFRAQHNYNSVSAISRLLSADPPELAQINNVSEKSSFRPNREVIIPVNCSCSGQYYQADTSHTLMKNDTYFTLASDVYQGLSTCNALLGVNSYDPGNLEIGLKLRVPLLCACPSSKQAENGTKYILTYSIDEDDSIPVLSDKFNVSAQAIAFANEFHEEDPLIYQLTTILIPLLREPLSSATIAHPLIQSPSPPYPFATRVLKNSKRTGLHVSIGVGLAILILLCAAFPIAFWIHRRRRRQLEEKKQHLARKDILVGIADADHILKVFEFEELNVATNNFSPESRIKDSVYRGLIRGSMMAIKETSRDVSKEVNILHKLNHFNLISLCGIGMGPESCYLVYDYMENGTLKDWLHDSSRMGLWSWTQRVRIAIDVANGLDYLHNFTELPHVHENINSSNVLLNSNLRAKIANFSFARSSERRGGGFIVTAKLKGSLGYMAPEYLASGQVTPKIDIYAFGVVMAELITGRDAVMKQGGREKLLSAVMVSIVQGSDTEAELSDFMDAGMRGICIIIQAVAMAKLSVACLREDPGSRPSMEEVVSTLLRIQGDSEYWEASYL